MSPIENLYLKISRAQIYTAIQQLSPVFRLSLSTVIQIRVKVAKAKMDFSQIFKLIVQHNPYEAIVRDVVRSFAVSRMDSLRLHRPDAGR